MNGLMDHASEACRNRGCLKSLARGVVALLATPFLLLAALGGDILGNARRRSRWWLVVDIATALLGVATLDWLVDAF